MAEDIPPKRIGRYFIHDEVGRDALGTVYRASQTDSGRDVALLILDPALAEDPAQAERFLSQAREAVHLNHSGIASILEVGEDEGRYFVAREQPPGIRLDRLLAKTRLSPGKALDILAQLALALDHVHSQGFFHGALWPGAIVIGPDQDSTDLEHVTLIGAGISYLGPSAGTLPTASAPYLAPERREPQNTVEVGAWSDIYGFAVIACQALTGRPLSPEGKGMPPHLWKALAPALSPDPGARPHRASQVFAGLHNALAPSTISMLPLEAGQGRPRPLQVLATIVVVVLMLVVAALAINRWFPDLLTSTGPSGTPSPAANAGQLLEPSRSSPGQARELLGTMIIPPVNPTDTPRPTSSATSTSSVAATVTPRPMPTSTPRPPPSTLVPPTATPTPLPTSTSTRALTPSPQPTLLAATLLTAPPDKESAVGSVTLRWQLVSGANGYRVETRSDREGQGDWRSWQASTNELRLVFDSYPDYFQVPGTVYRWRVAGLDGAAVVETYSSEWSFIFQRESKPEPPTPKPEPPTPKPEPPTPKPEPPTPKP